MARATARVSQTEQPRPTLPRNIAHSPAWVTPTPTATRLPAPQKTVSTSDFSPWLRYIVPATLAYTFTRRTRLYRRGQQRRRQHRKAARKTRRQPRRRTGAAATPPRPAPPAVQHDARRPLSAQPVLGPRRTIARGRGTTRPLSRPARLL